jgi:hypothetical protein
MIEEIRKKLRHIQIHNFPGIDLFIKSDEVSYVDHNRKLVYKKVFRDDLRNVLDQIKTLPVARIKEASLADQFGEFILEYVEGHDVFMHMKIHPEQAQKVCIQFEEFLAGWMNFSLDKNYLYSYSFDINPGNFIINPETLEIRKIDYLSDWKPGKKDFYFYLLPFLKLVEHRLISREFVRDLIDVRFKSKNLSFDTLFNEIQKNFLDTYKSIS